FQPWVRYFASLVMNRTTSSTTDETRGLGLPVPWGPDEPGYGQRTGLGLLAGGFARSKLAPLPAFFVDFLDRKSAVGEDFTWKLRAYQRRPPLILRDLIDTERETGSVPAALGATALGGLGFNVTTYGPRAPKARAGKPRLPFAGSGRSGVPL